MISSCFCFLVGFFPAGDLVVVVVVVGVGVGVGVVGIIVLRAMPLFNDSCSASSSSYHDCDTSITIIRPPKPWFLLLLIPFFRKP